METSDNSGSLPLLSPSVNSAPASTEKLQPNAFSEKLNVSSKSKSKQLHDSVEYVRPLEGLVDAEEVEDAFRIAYVDFQQDFTQEMKEIFFNKFESQLSLIQSDLASIKQQQTRQSVTSNLVDTLKKEIESLKEDNQRLKLQIENLKNSEKPTSRQLFFDNFDQPSKKDSSQDDDVSLSPKHTQNQSSNPQPSKGQIEMHASIQELGTDNLAEAAETAIFFLNPHECQTQRPKTQLLLQGDGLTFATNPQPVQKAGLFQLLL